MLDSISGLKLTEIASESFLNENFEHQFQKINLLIYIKWYKLSKFSGKQDIVRAPIGTEIAQDKCG